jgi:mannose-6-phosphate isomerase-like protein (cupin superfamily)
MAQLVHQSTIVPAVGTKPKRIEEFVGRVNTGHTGISLAKMSSPEGWQEPGQRPEFEEFTLVLSGLLRVETKNGRVDVRAGQAVITSPGEWVRYSTPDAGGADYIAVCQPAFSPETVNRDT